MTNPGREVKLSVGDATYTLYGGNRALRMMERDTGQSIVELATRLQRGEVDLLTTCLWALLTRHHPDLTIDACDDIIDDAGYESAMDAITAAMERAFPQAAAEAGAPKTGKPRRGTGTPS